MILRLKGVIAHGHNTKLSGEDGEGTTAGWGTRTRPRPKVKPFEEDHRDTLTHGLGNRPNPKKKSHVCRCGRQSRPGKVYTHLAMDRDQTRGRRDMTNEYSDGHRGTKNGGQTGSCIHSVFK